MTQDACASMVDLNVLLDMKEVDIGERSMEFGHETERMRSPVCRSSIHPFPLHLNLVITDEGFGGFECLFYSAGTQRTRTICFRLPQSLPIP